MECSESHILLQGIYKILLLSSTFSSGSGKQKQVGKRGLHKTVSFMRTGVVKYIYYLEVRMNLFWYCLHLLPDSGEIRWYKKRARIAVELFKFCGKGQPYFS